MQVMNATQVRNEWSAVLDSVIREKPLFIKRTRDKMIISDLVTLESLLSAYSFHAEVFSEDDGSVTLSLDCIDLVENGRDLDDALIKMSKSILEYAVMFYEDFTYWARGDRTAHIPFVFKALVLNDIGKIGELIQCRLGES